MVNPLIQTLKDKCNLSYTCIRACPAKAITIEDEHAKILHDRCVGCGNCVTVCMRDAIVYRNSKEEVKHLLSSGEKTAAICAPSIAGEFGDIEDYRIFVSMVRELGFDYVTEAAFGVDLVATRYKNLFQNFQGKYYITTTCPVVPSYIEKYHPQLVDNLAPIVTPHIAMAKAVHKRYGDNVKIVYISPCTAAKDEIKKHRDSGKIDAVISFTELREIFKENNIRDNKMEYSDFDPPLAKKGHLFPIRRGMLQAVDMNEDLLNGKIIITDGRNNFISSIQEFANNKELHQHLEAFYCEGCIMGPGTSKNGNKFSRRSQVLNFTNKRMADFNAANWQKEMTENLSLDLSMKFKARDRRLPFPSEIEIQDALNEMGKGNPEDQLGCGACGYASCRDFAIAKVQGLANNDMCYSFTIKRLNRYIKRMNTVNEQLKKTKEALKESEELARKEHQLALDAAETTSAMLQKLPSGVVIVDEELKIIESNSSFIRILGEDAAAIDEVIPGLVGADLKTLAPFYKYFDSVRTTGENLLNRDFTYKDTLLNISVFTIKKNKIVGGIIRDLQDPEVRKSEVVDRAKEVIRENLETVQRIAFLLGESASKTEKSLNSIIESQKPGKG